jgi:hypothetical protein
MLRDEHPQEAYASGMRSVRVLSGLAAGALAAGSLSACFSEPEAVLIASPLRPFIDLPATGTAASADVTITITNIGHAETGALQISAESNGVVAEHIGTGGDCKTIDSLGPLESCTLEFGYTNAQAPTGPASASVQVTGESSGGISIPIRIV